MSIRHPDRPGHGLPAQLAALALAAGMGVVVGAAFAPGWGVNPRDNASSARPAETAASTLSKSAHDEEDRIRYYESRLESVLHDGELFALAYDADGQVVVTGSSRPVPPNTSRSEGPEYPLP